MTALLVPGILLSLLWILIAARLRAAYAQTRHLAAVLERDGPPAVPLTSPSADALPSLAAGALPSLSVVVTARDEAAGIESTVRRLLTQRYPGLQVVVVDDRSSDGTSDILRRLVVEEAGAGAPRGRLTVIHNRALPPGWLGKCYACFLGAAAANGEWILFLDGDVELLRDDLLALSVRHAERHGLDHLAVLPDLRPMPVLQTALVSVFGQMYLLAARAWEMARDLPRAGAGVGAFNLMRRVAYDRVGGYLTVRMDPADDFKLGRLLKESGARQRIFQGLDLVSCAWHVGTLNVMRGLEKNLFAGCDYSLLKTIGMVFGGLLFELGPAAIGVVGTTLTWRDAHLRMPAVWLPYLLQTGLLLIGYRPEARRYGTSPLWLALLHPFAVLLLIAALVNSTVHALRRGGILWRDTFYPLDALRAGLVPPGAGRSARAVASDASDNPGR